MDTLYLSNEQLQMVLTEMRTCTSDIVNHLTAVKDGLVDVETAIEDLKVEVRKGRE